MSRLGVFPSGAGTDGQYFSNLVFLMTDTQAMSWWTAHPAMQRAIADPDISVEACKKFWIYMNSHMLHLMGDVAPPACPYPWMNLPKLSQFCDEITAAFETVKTKDELNDLLWSWFNYIHRLNRWFFLIVPWEHGEKYQRRTKEEIRDLVEKGELPPEVLVA